MTISCSAMIVTVYSDVLNVGELTEAEINAVLREKRRRALSVEGKAMRRRAHLKLTYRGRHAHRIDESIAQCELKLELLKEIKSDDAI